ncbi:hypothetical protein RFI_32034 [Reticulomyxa filosa]|uniref:Peptidyl-prolyl cis-trans isomerase n=1 Tax=Reticulomyxa filosa TaxID=46433 RepID=X6LXD1_RETFI|nr:hypothetical protein RFI_32034 [Reticulomyxa filosa]|eukprot:ETO05360.1 hypothetical protein RFI_32034 [Reticulomyxa filosa]
MSKTLFLSGAVTFILAPCYLRNHNKLEKITHKVYLDVSIDSKAIGRIIIGLFGETVPRTVYNFKCLCTGEKGISESGSKVKLHYKGSIFHRIVPNFVAQGGDFICNDGKGGECVFAKDMKTRVFPDENFALSHCNEGYVSMCNRGENTNGSQFFITLGPCPFLNGKHVVFGKVIEGMNIVKQIEQYGSKVGTPTARVVIQDCGEIIDEVITTDEKEKNNNI